MEGTIQVPVASIWRLSSQASALRQMKIAFEFGKLPTVQITGNKEVSKLTGFGKTTTFYEIEVRERYCDTKK